MDLEPTHHMAPQLNGTTCWAYQMRNLLWEEMWKIVSWKTPQPVDYKGKKNWKNEKLIEQNTNLDSTP